MEGISPEYSDYLINWLYEILYNDALICQNPILPQTISYQEIIHGDYSVYKQALANRESEVDADDALIILHTSGTAGQPQGSLPIHYNVISMSLVQKDEFHLADDMQAGNMLLTWSPVNHFTVLLLNMELFLPLLFGHWY